MKKKKILLVDDEVTNLNLLKQLLNPHYQLAFATDGTRALEVVNHGSVDLILLDLMMPELDGWDVLKKLKNDPVLQSIPIIIQSSLTSIEDFQKGLSLGAFYYVKKPIQPEELLPLVRAAIRENLQIKMLKENLAKEDFALSLTDEWRIHFRTPEQAISISKLLSKACPDPDRVLPGLLELLINAVEHGIAAVGYDAKTEYLKTDSYSSALTQRLESNLLKNKYAHLHFLKQKEQIRIQINDPGPGFEWRKYLNFSMERAADSHGRGIALANAMSFDQLSYSEKGNEVTVKINLD